jgi:tetratricopeptide (TPR) repeat protein
MRWHTGLVYAALATVFLSGAAEAQQKQKNSPTLSNICARGEVDARIRACTELIKRGGRDAELYYFRRSSAYSIKGQCDPAYADAEKALSLKRDGYNFARLAFVLLDCRNDADRAIANFNEATRLAQGCGILCRPWQGLCREARISAGA